MSEKILGFIREKGPSLPVELVSEVGGDSFVANAYLSELVDKKDLLKSDEKVGTVHLYFLPGQEADVKKRLAKLDDKKTARTFSKKPIDETAEVIEKRRKFEDRLKSIETAERVREEEKLRKAAKDQKSALERARRLLKKTVKPVIPKVEKRVELHSVEDESFMDVVQSYLKDRHIGVSNVGEDTCVALVPSSVGPVRFFVKLKEKKKLNKTDLAEAHSLALEKRMPVILVTNGAVAKTAKNYLKEIGSLVRVKSFK
tara:strand:+ start:922 stop:1692 length:771 start_codon:yes stop_codon:yes gene_type:complete